MQFAERDFERASRMLVPPEPHVATPHDQTFLITIGTVGAGAIVLWLVDQARASNLSRVQSPLPASFRGPGMHSSTQSFKP
jgi:hypothetical protein